MSRSVKNVSYACNNNINNYHRYYKCNSFILRICIISLVLVTNLVDCLTPEDPDWNYYKPNHISRDENTRRLDPIRDDNSEEKGSTFNFKSSDFEVNYEVHRGDHVDKAGADDRDSDDDNNIHDRQDRFGPSAQLDANEELVRRAMQEGILLSPAQWAKLNNIRERVPISQSARIGEDEIQMPPNEAFIPKVPAECEGATVCEKSETYPTDYIKSLVKNRDALNLFAGGDEGDKIIPRINLDDEYSLCQSESRKVFPKSIRQNESAPWHYVANVDGYRQGYLVETCLHPGGSCTQIGSLTDNLEPGVLAFCKQQEGPKPIVVLSRDNGTLLADRFLFPTGCCCHIKRSSSRFGEISDSNNLVDFHPTLTVFKHPKRQSKYKNKSLDN